MSRKSAKPVRRKPVAKTSAIKTKGSVEKLPETAVSTATTMSYIERLWSADLKVRLHRSRRQVIGIAVASCVALVLLVKALAGPAVEAQASIVVPPAATAVAPAKETVAKTPKKVAKQHGPAKVRKVVHENNHKGKKAVQAHTGKTAGLPKDRLRADNANKKE